MGHAPPRRVALAHALLALLVVLSVTACGAAEKAATPPAPSIAATPTDPEIAATGLPDDVDIEVTDSSPGSENGDNLDFVSPVFTLTPIGPLERAATVTLRLDNALPATTPLLVASRESESADWTYARGRLTSDQRHVEFKTTSLNQVGVFAIDLAGATQGFQSDVRTGLAPLPTKKKLVKPTCVEPKAARESGYVVSATQHKTLYWCFGLRQGKRVLKITNRRPIPVEVTHADMEVVKVPGDVAAYALWPKILGTTNTIVAPGHTATYDAELEPESKVQIVAASTPEAQSLRVLQAGTRALVIRLDDFSAGPAQADPTVKALLDRPRCARALSKGVDTVVTRCFTTAKLVKIFGSRALLLQPLVSAPSFPAFFGRLGKALSSRAADQRERVVVRRAQQDFTDLLGLWSGHTRLLTVNAQGVATEKIQDGCCALVVQLTYQLDNPVTKAGTTTADATITAVRVGKRKLLKGRVPKVGDTGRITLRKGVITPPFLKTNYCDGKAAKKGTCGA
ncbi:MAG: hypothetical protein ABIR34_01825 [Marmoricola sp.]